MNDCDLGLKIVNAILVLIVLLIYLNLMRMFEEFVTKRWTNESKLVCLRFELLSKIKIIRDFFDFILVSNPIS
jgi:hypothetical protein